MCGIIGYVGNQEAWPIILEGLQRLEYRGYDSAGIAVIDPDGKLEFRKTVGKVKGLLDNLQLGVPRGSVGLGHTRWATHGAPSHANAHPHTECTHRVAVVHNGIVENFLELKRDLQARGHAFTSETDSEVIAHLIEEGLSEGYSLERACREMAGLLRGSQAIAAMWTEDEPVLCALRLGHAGGLVVAHHKGQGIVGSDLAAALPLLGRNCSSQRVVYLESGEMALITRETVKYQDLDGNSLVKQSARVSPEDLFIDKGGHRHFMLKEIMEQPQAVSGAMRERVDLTKGRVVLPEFPISDIDICSLDKVVLIGCGTSLHAAQVGRHLVERLAGLPAEADSASEFRYRSPLINSQTLVVSIGQSGETADTIAAMQEAQERGARLITICNTEGSQATRLAEGTLYMRSGIEIGVASTKTFIASLTILTLLAAYLGQVRGFLTHSDSRQLVDDLALCPRLLGEVLAGAEKYQDLARRLNVYNNFLFLGRGMNAIIALEGALKLKEISYIHAEGYPAGEMKHGPIALIDRQMATLALAPQDKLYDKMVSNIREVKARDGVVIAVLTEGDEELAAEVDEVIFIPHVPEALAPLVTTVPLQLLAYHIAVRRGCDVDQPRNLAKSVTVE